jgi:hypothetical protein
MFELLLVYLVYCLFWSQSLLDLFPNNTARPVQINGELIRKGK